MKVVLSNTSNYGLIIHNDHSFSLESKTFFDFLENEGYNITESDIIQKIKSDKMSGYELIKNPKNKLNEYFDIKIPEQVNLTVVLEDPKNFGLVIRNAKGISD